ncbi:MAG TPA: aminotransferase class I/II-fold pyridoxal phosphate-dependent enzyme [Stellaceae bacterium]|nr:aminotransferase class I/II-fold pyridoxal phosphate-dependent enzyme [Stellaceae bacterium]
MIRKPILPADPEQALTGSMRDFRELDGPDLLARVEPFFRWQETRRENGLWAYSKTTQEAPLAECTARDEIGESYQGINFGSQDYLGLSSDPEIKETAKAVIDEYGVHSAGSSALAGNTKYSAQLERTISEFLNLKHTILYPTGWAAGYGVIKGLVRPHDHVVLDGLAHACLQEGATSATPNVRQLERIRRHDTQNAILVVTESLFSMDSDTPDLAALQDLCREFNATLLVDVAHDLGCIAEDGRGFIGQQQMLGKIDIVMGSFSKTFGSNGGFVSCNSPAVRQYLKFYGCSATFSNTLSPVQAATVIKAFEIVQSERGRWLREQLMNRVLLLREKLAAEALELIGVPSAIVPVVVGDEAFARLVSRQLPAWGIVANMVEFPAVAKGNARFRLQVMPGHSPDHITTFVTRFLGAIEAARVDYERYRTRGSSQKQEPQLAHVA